MGYQTNNDMCEVSKEEGKKLSMEINSHFIVQDYDCSIVQQIEDTIKTKLCNLISEKRKLNEELFEGNKIVSLLPKERAYKIVFVSSTSKAVRFMENTFQSDETKNENANYFSKVTKNMKYDNIKGSINIYAINGIEENKYAFTIFMKNTDMFVFVLDDDTDNEESDLLFPFSYIIETFGIHNKSKLLLYLLYYACSFNCC